MTTAKIKVLHVIRDLEIGGAQEVVRTLVKYLASNDCLPMVCTFKDGPLRHEIERLGFRVEILTPPRHSFIFFPGFIADMVRIWRSLTGLVKKNNIDIIQTHLLRTLDFLVLFLKYTTPVRAVLWTFHSTDFELTKNQLSQHKWLLKPKNFIHRHLYRRTSDSVSSLIAVSDEVKTAMLHIIGPIQDKITVIYNGVDIKRYGMSADKMQVRSHLGLKANACLIAVLAILKEEKGHRYLIEAMKSVTSQIENVHTLLIGDGPLRYELQEHVKRLNLEGYIHFLGNRHDVPELLATSDLFVLPSICEGFSMALLEAMASGKPIVATAVSGTVQIMIANKTGLIVPPQNSLELSKAIIQLLSNPEQAHRMGQTAKQRVEANYGAQKQAEKHLVLYNSILVKQRGV
jgi:glycosyltransferase involved in cell wall biosynthesis